MRSMNNVITPAVAMASQKRYEGMTPLEPGLGKAAGPPIDTKDRSPDGFCSWLFHEPCSHIPVFVYLAAGAFQGIALAASISGVDDMCTYALCAGVVVSILASYFYYTIGTLRDQIENMEDQNEMFEHQNNRLHEQLEQLEMELDAFQGLQTQFRKWGLSNYNSMVSVAKNFVSLFNSLAGVTKKQEELLLDNMRNLLWKTAQDIEFSDGKPGMNEAQFNEFVGRIPARLRPSWEQVRNNTYARLRNSSGKIARTNLNIAIDNVIENHRRVVREANDRQLRRMSVENVLEYREEGPSKPLSRNPMNYNRSATSSDTKSVRQSRFTGARRSRPRGQRTRSSLQNHNLRQQVVNPHHRMPGAQSPAQLPRTMPVQYPQQSSAAVQHRPL